MLKGYLEDTLMVPIALELWVPTIKRVQTRHIACGRNRSHSFGRRPVLRRAHHRLRIRRWRDRCNRGRNHPMWGVGGWWADIVQVMAVVGSLDLLEQVLPARRRESRHAHVGGVVWLLPRHQDAAAGHAADTGPVIQFRGYGERRRG